MWPYVLLVVLPILIQHFNIQNGTLKIVGWKQKSKIALIVFFIILFLLLVLRNEKIGIDLMNYKAIFRSIGVKSWPAALTRSFEYANNFLLKAVASISSDFRWIIVISAVLSIGFLAYGYVRHSPDAALTIVLFINMSNFVVMFSALKQSVAVSFGFLAFEFVRRKKPVFFILVVVIAVLFHSSAFMILFMYPLYHLRVTRKWLVFVIPALVLLFVFNQPVFLLLGTVLSSFTKYETSITLTGSYTMLAVIVILAVFSFLIPDEKKLDKDTIGMRNFLLLAVVLQMFAPLHTVAMRMNYYYIIFIPLVIPRIIESRSVRWNQIAVISRYAFILLFGVYFFMVVYQKNDLMTFPYRFFWETA